MKKIYSYDNHEGDKGIIIADSFDDAVSLFKDEYPDRTIAESPEQYWDHGSYIEEIGPLGGKNGLYIVCEW